MAIDLSNLDQKGIRSWGPTLALSLHAEVNKIAKSSDRELDDYNFTELKKSLANFEEIRNRAKELNLNVYGNVKK